MNDNQFFRCFYTLLIVSFLFTTCTNGKGFGRGGGFKGGSRGGFGGSKGGFSGSSGYNRGNNYGSYNSMYKPSSGSSFKKNAMSFGAGAVGGIAAYSLMRSMSHSYRPGYYEPGYGTGEKCFNNEDLNGTRFGEFRCPLNGFSREARYCCGEYGKQYCCTPQYSSNRPMRSSFSLVWICIIVAVIIIAIVLLVKHRRHSYKESTMVPAEPPFEDQGPAFYQPPPPPQMNYPPNVNPYTVPPQNYDGNYTPYPPQAQMSYPPAQMSYPQVQMPYPPQQPPYNPYQVTEAAPPNYHDTMKNNQAFPTTKPT